jgi:hypothetical protein
MSSIRDPNQQIKAFLNEGLDELPDRSYDAVRAAIDTTRQWAVVGPWTEPQIRTPMRIALAAAAVLTVAFLGSRLLPATSFGPASSSGPRATPPDTIVPTAQPSAAILRGHASLAAGDYVISDARYTRAPVSFTLPSGWMSTEGFLVKGNSTDAWANHAVVATWIVDNVYADACHWQGTMHSVTTASEIVDALATQKGRDVFEPRTVSLGGTPATLVRISVADDFDAASCDGGLVRNWPDPGGNEDGGWRSIPGQTDDVYVVNSAQGPFVIFATALPKASEDDAAELARIVDSIQIETD